ncbi:MAG: Uncharacterised protein [Formosa sp. Hel1_33_131]|jgi:hypothetical protein|nr:MAG: Uncharacterised protein [Formosa sp. Hel1_33_131]|tara:strand:- start:321 stop:671 length:351 start_codon:yes stop_codon:yes gene_type:complete
MTHKEKILKYLNLKGIKTSVFYRNCKFSNGFLDSGKSFGADKLAIILDNYQDLNVTWLLHDIGEMLLSDPSALNEPKLRYGKDVKDLLYEQIEENRILKLENKSLKETVENLRKTD